MKNVDLLTDAQLMRFVLEAQDVQKRNPPSSEAWKAASVVINACVNENNRRHPA